MGEGADTGFDGDYEGFNIKTQSNGGRARVRGFEVAYQQRFTFLPGWWSGFGADANCTRLHTQGDYGSTTVRSTKEIAVFTPNTANIGSSYIKGGHNVRLQFNYIGRFLMAFSATQALLQDQVARPLLDIKTVFRINRQFDAYLEVWNVFSNPTEQTEFFGGRSSTMSKINFMLHGGVRWRM